MVGKGGAKIGIALIEPIFAFSMESNMSGTPKENQRFRWSGTGRHKTESQKLSLDSPSVWTANCKELRKKMKDLGGGQNSESQKSSLVWKAKCKEFWGKMKDLRGMGEGRNRNGIN